MCQVIFAKIKTLSSILIEIRRFRFLTMEGRGRIRPQIGPPTFLKIFLLEMIYSGKSQHSEPSYAIFNTSLYYWG